MLTTPSRGITALQCREDDRTEHVGLTHHHQNHHSHSYHITFEKESGERLELKVKRHEYKELSIGDRGVLTHQGTRYQGFVR